MARKNVVLENQNAVYHCINRCVRRAFLCGTDSSTGNNYEHRKGWLESRFVELSKLFFINTFAYVVMENHYHTVIEADFEQAQETDPREIARRWLSLTCHIKDEKGKNDYTATRESIDALVGNEARIAEIRRRLSSVSWYMRYVNEWVSRRANKEDNSKGHFWESRFKCQRLDDEGAILTCMCYVDLNPIRAKVAQSPESSSFTSAYWRIQKRQSAKNKEIIKEIQRKENLNNKQKDFIVKSTEDVSKADFLVTISDVFSNKAIQLDAYLELLDWTGREICEDKIGAMPMGLGAILTRVDLDSQNWVDSVSKYGSLFYYFAGKIEDLAKLANMLAKHWCCGKKGAL